MAERWPEKLYALRGGPVTGYLEAALVVNDEACERNGIEIAEYIQLSAIEEQIERHEAIELTASSEAISLGAEGNFEGEREARVIAAVHKNTIQDLWQLLPQANGWEKG